MDRIKLHTTHPSVARLKVAHEDLREVDKTDHIGLEHDVDVIGRDVSNVLAATDHAGVVDEAGVSMVAGLIS